MSIIIICVRKANLNTSVKPIFKEMMKKTILIFSMIALILGSCEKSSINIEKENYDNAYLKHNSYVTSGTKSEISGVPELSVAKNGVAQTELMGRVFCSQESFDLIAGQTIPAGIVIISNDQNNLLVTYQAENGWKIKEVHLYAGTMEDLPVNPQNIPVPGHFPINESFNPLVEQVTYEIPLQDLGECFIVAAHAVVVKDCREETAWGKGTLSFESELGIKRWGWLISTCQQKCEGEELVIALKSYVVDPEQCNAEKCEPIWWAVSNGTGTTDNCLGIGFNKFRTDDPSVHVYDLIRYGDPSTVEGKITLSVTRENDITYLNVLVDLANDDLALSKTYLYAGTEKGLQSYFYKYNGSDCYMFYNWFFQEDDISNVHAFSISLGEINEK
jgi:hypothetical protein